MKTKVEYFEQPLISCNFLPGYRIKIENCNLSRKEIINFLSDNFGEGVVDDSYKKYNFLKIDSESWYFFIKNEIFNNYIIVLKTIYQVDKFLYYFNLKVEIDYKTLSIKRKLEETLEKYLFELNTQKIRNKIREDVRKILHIKPYDFDLIVDEKGIQIIEDDFKWIISRENINDMV